MAAQEAQYPPIEGSSTHTCKYYAIWLLNFIGWSWTRDLSGSSQKYKVPGLGLAKHSTSIYKFMYPNPVHSMGINSLVMTIWLLAKSSGYFDFIRAALQESQSPDWLPGSIPGWIRPLTQSSFSSFCSLGQGEHKPLLRRGKDTYVPYQLQGIMSLNVYSAIIIFCQ